MALAATNASRLDSGSTLLREGSVLRERRASGERTAASRSLRPRDARRIELRSHQDIEAMALAGSLAANVLAEARAACVAGATTGQLEHIVRSAILAGGGE
ncbi:MAG: hypothetical protein ACKO3W_02660, partial [bacterium]